MCPLSLSKRTLCSPKDLSVHRSHEQELLHSEQDPAPMPAGLHATFGRAEWEAQVSCSGQEVTLLLFWTLVAAPWLSALGPSGWILLGPLALCMQPPKSSSFPSSNPHSASISPFLTPFAATPHPLKTFHCALGSRGHSSRIFCILILFLKCSLHLLALQQNSHLRILLFCNPLKR